MDDARHRALTLRARLYTVIRAFFAERAVIEVDTPILGQAASTDIHLESFDTGYTGPANGGARRRFLRTSPEFWHKRLLAEGLGDCYELGRVFRNGEFGRRHNPEFTLLEWYRLGWTSAQLMAEVEELVRTTFMFSGRRLG
ncbi:MAG: amino acid--tRNA ligase-related protein, partial [Lysobacterales bacterium]